MKILTAEEYLHKHPEYRGSLLGDCVSVPGMGDRKVGDFVVRQIEDGFVVFSLTQVDTAGEEAIWMQAWAGPSIQITKEGGGTRVGCTKEDEDRILKP